MHYFQFNIGDYASHTRHLSPMEDLAYRRLLDLYYLKDGQVYGDEAEIARQVGMRDNVAEVKQVLQDFFCIEEDDRWSHARCDAEIADYRAYLEKQRENGKRGGRPKKGIDDNPEKPTANPNLTQSKPKKSLTTNHKPLTTNQDILTSKEVMSETPVSDADDEIDVKDVMHEWNDIAANLGKPKVRDLTPERRQLLKARLAQYKIEDFVTVFDKIERSAFLRGDTGWSGCTFDWVFKKGNFQKILEGNYDQ